MSTKPRTIYSLAIQITETKGFVTEANQRPPYKIALLFMGI